MDAEKEAYEAVFAQGHMTVNDRAKTRSQAHRQVGKTEVGKIGVGYILALSHKPLI